MAEQNRTHDVIRQCGGIVHSDGNIFFTNRYQFEHAASILLGCATVAVPVCSGDTQPLYPQVADALPLPHQQPGETPDQPDGDA